MKYYREWYNEYFPNIPDKDFRILNCRPHGAPQEQPLETFYLAYFICYTALSFKTHEFMEIL
eukprot:snap_masked-scaffold_24-processed-gene-4.30-mRNA-1 protein AED:1.00 eAED:1.00 QI:0/-1/0/0/-1/1/1/0/61